MSDDRFERVVREVFAERAPREASDDLRARVREVPREVPLPRHRPSRLLGLAAGLAAVAVVGGSLLAVVALRGMTVGPSAPTPPPSGLRHFGNADFSFDYPATWQVLLDARQAFPAATLVAVGTPGSTVRCSTGSPGPSGSASLKCSGTTTTVPGDGVVVLVQVGPPLPAALPSFPGTTHTPVAFSLGATPAPGATRVLVGGRPADRVETGGPPGGLIQWRFDAQGDTEISADFGPQRSTVAEAQVVALIASWQWNPRNATPSPAANSSVLRSASPTGPTGNAGWSFRLASPGNLTPVRGPDGRTYLATSPWGSTGQGKVYALDGAGKVRSGWPFAPSGVAAFATPAVAPDGTVYVLGWAYGKPAPQAPGSNAAWIWALDPAGTVKPGWPYAIQGSVAAGSAPLSVRPAGGVVFTEQLVSADGAPESEAVALDPAGHPIAGWPVPLPGGISCFVQPCAAVDSDGTFYAMVALGKGPDTEIVALRPDGSEVPGWPVHVAGGEGFTLASGTIYAWGIDTNGVVPPKGITQIVRTRFLALGPGGRAKPGWPVTVQGPAGVPTIGPDGTLFTTTGATGQAESVLGLGPDGHERPGWPYAIPPDTAAWPYAPSEGMPARATSPFVAPDGTVLLPVSQPSGTGGRQGLLALTPGGQVAPVWPVWLPTDTNLATVGGYSVGSGGDLVPPVFGTDGTTYVAVSSGTAAELLALQPNGLEQPGWPHSMGGQSSTGDRIVDLVIEPGVGLLVTAQTSVGGSAVVSLVPLP